MSLGLLWGTSLQRKPLGLKKEGKENQGRKMIRKTGNSWVLFSEDGKKRLETFKTRDEAIAREGQVIYFKPRKK